MFVSVIVSLSTGNKNRNLTSSHQDHYDLNTAVNPWDIFSRSSLNRLLSFPNVSIKCLDFTIATKRGLTRNDDCYKNTQRDVPGGLNDIGEGGTDMFSKKHHQRSRDSLWQKSADSIEELFLSERFIFRDCETVMLLGWMLNVGSMACSFMTML